MFEKEICSEISERNYWGEHNLKLKYIIVVYWFFSFEKSKENLKSSLIFVFLTAISDIVKYMNKIAQHIYIFEYSKWIKPDHYLAKYM